MPAKRHRVTRGEDYRFAVRTGRRVGGAYCITHAVLRSPTGRLDASSQAGAPAGGGERAEGSDPVPPARFGFIISKAVGNAVTRNLVRRRMKSVVERRIRSGIRGVDVVFRALPAAAGAPFSELEREMNRALDRVERELVAGEQR
ncbi:MULTISPECIES: ribonuclease P protein component [Leucobacter]|uniref:ribonuclease P protein component n=1 Tax=Leucobacter TaxID=55968 RepID=UPI0009DB27AB|nr:MULTISPECIES: ribonuclease P protein component [Leucobacter]